MKIWQVALMLQVLGACATSKPYNYEALQQSKPRSILVLPPDNKSPDLRGSYSVMATLTRPLAERGYYVFPVEIVDKFMKDNGVQNPYEMHQVSLRKLNEVFAPDSVLYVQITDYGTNFQLVDSVSTVKFIARLVDSKTAKLLWDGEASLSQSASQRSGGANTGLLGMVVNAALAQAIDTSTDYAYSLAQSASYSLVWNQSRGLPLGPLSPKFNHYQPEVSK